MLLTNSAFAADENFDTARSAAEQGDAEAQFNLGYIYATGLGVPVDDTEAIYWYRKSAEQGYVTAEFHLGLMYLKGEGVPEDYVEAAHWLKQSAEQGHSEGQHLLGLLYAAGKGVPENPKVAYAWISIAAAQGVELAQRDKEIVSGGMTHEEIAEVQKLSWILWDTYEPGRSLSSAERVELKLKARQAIAMEEADKKRKAEEERKRREEAERRLAEQKLKELLDIPPDPGGSYLQVGDGQVAVGGETEGVVLQAVEVDPDRDQASDGIVVPVPNQGAPPCDVARQQAGVVPCMSAGQAQGRDHVVDVPVPARVDRVVQGIVGLVVQEVGIDRHGAAAAGGEEG